MKSSLVAIIAATACLLAGAPVSAAAPRTAASGVASAGSKGPAAQTMPVDINSATKAQLMKLPGIGAADADRIIAGRPYLSKAHLVTRGVIDRGTYQQISSRIMARQKSAAARR